MKVGLKLDGVGLFGRKKIAVPTGNYEVRIAEAEVRETKAKNGHCLKLTYVINKGEYEGNELRSSDFINIDNPSEDATRIGLSIVKTIMTVGGHKNPNMLNDTDELIGLCFGIYTEEEPDSFDDSQGNKVETTKNNYRSYFEFTEEETASSPTKTSQKKAKAPAKKKAEAKPAPESAEPAPAPQAEGSSSFPWMN
jgi:hypothetical protein